MIVIFGQRFYGQVDTHGDEHVVTKFAHVYWLPMVPTESMWVTRRQGDQLFGFEVAMSGRSVAAAYLRVWAPLLALGAIATMSVVGFAIAAGLLALSAWSWTWRRLRNSREHRRAVFNQVVFGTACDPLRRRAAQCDVLRPTVEAHFAELSGGKTPDDVVRFGAETPLQAAFAYANLRLVAATARGDTARKARDASERILDGLKDGDAGALADGGPYRARERAPDFSLGALQDAAAAAGLQPSVVAPPPPPDAWQNHPNNPAVQAEITANKRKNKRKNAVIVGVFLVGAAVVGGFVYGAHQRERAAADRGMAELQRVRDEVCGCLTAACQHDVLRRNAPDIDRAEKAVRVFESDSRGLDDLVRQVERCMADMR